MPDFPSDLSTWPPARLFSRKEVLPFQTQSPAPSTEGARCQAGSLDKSVLVDSSPENSWCPGRTLNHWPARLVYFPGKTTELMSPPWWNLEQDVDFNFLNTFPLPWLKKKKKPLEVFQVPLHVDLSTCGLVGLRMVPHTSPLGSRGNNRTQGGQLQTRHELGVALFPGFTVNPQNIPN